MEAADGLLDDPPPGAHCLLAPVHLHHFVFFVDELALVELLLNPALIGTAVLIRAGVRVDANFFPCVAQALIFQRLPLLAL